jgi:transposase
MANEYWLSDRAWASIEPLMPTTQPGARRVDDRRVVSGIIHVLQSGCRWKDCPAVYGPPTTIYNRFNRWSRKRLWLAFAVIGHFGANSRIEICRKTLITSDFHMSRC